MRRPLIGLLMAQAVSIAGTRMSMLALPWFVLSTTGSATRMGVVAFAEMLPYVLGALLAAPAVDRAGPRRASIACDLGSAVAVGLVPLLHLADRLSFPALLALVAVAGALRGPGDNAKHVLMPDAAERSATPLPRASALYDGVNRAAGLIGAPLAGVLIGVMGPAQVLLVDAASFLAALVLVAALVPPATGQARAPAEPEGYLSQLRVGVSFLVRDRLLLAIAGMLLLTNLLDQAYGAVLLPVWSRDAGHGALGVGLVGGTFALGATAGSLTLAVRRPPVHRRRTFLLAFLVAGAPRFAAAALGAPLAVVLAVALVGGLAAGALNPILTVVELERVPEQLRARVLSASAAVSFGGIPLGGLLGGALVTAAGVRPALALVGGVYLLATLAPLGRTWRAMDAPAGHQQAAPEPEPAAAPAPARR